MERPNDSPAVVEKTSAWSDAEREKVEPPTPEVPDWVVAFAFGDVLTHNGWEAVVRHVGEGEPGKWFVMLEPVRRVATKPTRAMKRAEFRRLKAKVGKKKAWEAMDARSKPA